MASGVTRISDLVVPEIFSPYTQQLTTEKSRLIQSGAMVSDASLDAILAGGGVTFNEPSYKDLDDDAENTSTDDPATNSSPNKVQTATEIQVRLSRNNSWSSMDLNGDLTGSDPLNSITNRVASYWVRRQQAAFVASMKGLFADNAAAPSGTDTHTQGDVTHDISGVSFADGVTNFSAESFIDTTLTMGDSMQDLTMLCMHSIVYGRMQKNNLIDFVPDSQGLILIPTFLGREVVVDDGVPFSGGVFETWLFGRGALRYGSGSPKVPTEVFRAPSAGNGSGQDILFNRVQWCIHPVGHAFIGAVSSGVGGPTNASTSNNLANAGSWSRVFPQRKQIKIARLITREF